MNARDRELDHVLNHHVINHHFPVNNFFSATCGLNTHSLAFTGVHISVATCETTRTTFGVGNCNREWIFGGCPNTGQLELTHRRPFVGLEFKSTTALAHVPRQRLRTSARISSERCFLLNRRQRFSVNARIMSERCCGGNLSQTARRAWWPSF